MGIPYYFATLLKKHAGITRTIKDRLEVDVFGIDMNCLIHRYLKDSDPITSVLDALEHILKCVCQGKQLIIALDGLVPYAKMVQQRYRRMHHKEEAIFDRNQISPDTPYMRELEREIRSRFPYAILSSTQIAGEGEHKLFHGLTDQKSVCIYGLDADLILLSLFNCKKTMFLLRESGEFNDPKLAQAEFSLLSIPALLASLPINIEQYLVLCVMCFGNDFMPNLGIFSLREGGYERAIDMYEKAGSPNLFTDIGRFEFLLYASKFENKILSEHIRSRRRPEERAIVGRDPHSVSRKYGLHILDGVQDMYPVVEAYWKTFHWTIHYFRTNDVLDWNWVYPYPDAPLIQDLVQFYETKCERTPLTYTITKHLQFILPAKSLHASNRLVKFKDEIYSETRNPWMKRYDWEMKPRISLPWHPTDELTSISPLLLQLAPCEQKQ